jgi:hypothetical protein
MLRDPCPSRPRSLRHSLKEQLQRGGRPPDCPNHHLPPYPLTLELQRDQGEITDEQGKTMFTEGLKTYEARYESRTDAYAEVA